jgi:hypothetical protein
MKITKDFIETWNQKQKQPRPRNGQNQPSEQFVYRLLKQCKQLSQLVARSWLEDELAATLRDYLIRPHTDDSEDGRLKELLGSTGEPLSQIFKSYELPIFNEYELQHVYKFSVDWEVWEGSINDVKAPNTEQNKPYFDIVIPYPPRPALGEATVTLTQLQAWVSQDVTDPNGNLLIDDDHQIYPPYPYIPPTSC